MSNTTEHALTKVPEVTLIFWIIKITATTLGETGGDAVSMSMNLGYLVGTAIFAVVFIVSVTAQIKAERFHPFLYWTTIIATTTVGTTLADFADRSLGIGYAGGSLLLLTLLMVSLAIWYRTLGSVSVDTVSSPSLLCMAFSSSWVRSRVILSASMAGGGMGLPAFSLLCGLLEAQEVSVTIKANSTIGTNLRIPMVIG